MTRTTSVTTDGSAADVSAPPGMPPGRALELVGRGTTWIYEAGRHGQQCTTLFLLHGWMASGSLNWFTSFSDLAKRYHVVAIDHRGHGRGIRTRERFRLQDCADDVAAAADALGIERFIPVGYSMGGPIAQLVWRRHRDRVTGLVLCATARNFRGRPSERALFGALGTVALASRFTPPSWHEAIRDRVLRDRLADLPESRWALQEMRRHDPRLLVEAGAAIGRFSSHHWIGGVDVPTAVVVTTADTIVPPHRQLRLAQSIPGATVHFVAADHGACALRPQHFVPTLTDAINSVVARSRLQHPAAG
ncbi:MAG: alpha/beta hydrolase [Acidimicrobiales bacterium]|nr:alpha/beta hydrolase [Acidimicrobiales bacterium]